MSRQHELLKKLWHLQRFWSSEAPLYVMWSTQTYISDVSMFRCGSYGMWVEPFLNFLIY